MTLESERPIFIVGCPRSGTTLLQLMLHGHPRIAIPPETRFLLPAYFRRLSFGDLELRRNRRRVARFVQRPRTRFRDLGLDRRRTRREVAAAPPTLGSLLATVYRAYARRFDRPRWGDKRPLYHGYLEVILRLFPDAQVIHLVRDPRDCVASLKRVPWWKGSVYHSISAWAQSIDNTDEALRRWPGAVTRISYERLVSDPEQELRALAEALGEEYDAQMAEPERVAELAVPGRKHWHAKTRGAPSTEYIGRWRSDLEPGEIALCERVLAGRMERFGYERRGSARAGVDHLVRYAYVHRTRAAVRRKRLAQDRWRRRREPNPVAARPPALQDVRTTPR
jgi:Sulfotransferase family